MWRHFASRRLFLSSLHSSSSSTIVYPRLVPSSLFSSCFNYSSHAPPYSVRQDEETRKVRVSVWWDFNSCNLPTGIDVIKVPSVINSGLRANGIKGPVEIHAFGDVWQLASSSRVPLYSIGIKFVNVPNGRPPIYPEMLFWVDENPSPAHLFLISCDTTFTHSLHSLRMNNYNILVASVGRAADILCDAASIMWHWNSLVTGEILIGRHFNYPPDDSYGSWCGHLEAPIGDSVQ